MCKSCAENQIKDYCTNSKKERAFSGIYVSTELTKALEKGYEVEEIYEVWHYENTDFYNKNDPESGLFTKVKILLYAFYFNISQIMYSYVRIIF